MSIFNRGRSHSTTAPYTPSSYSDSSYSLVDRTLSAPTYPNHALTSRRDILARNPALLARLYDALADNSVYPPEYSTLAPIMPRSAIHPRPEEGREVLPKYSPAVYLESIMCRKLELNTPYLSSTQRSWHLVYVQLNNTQLNFYNLTPTHTHSLKRKSDVLPPSAADSHIVTDSPRNPHDLPGTLVENGTFRVGNLLRSFTLQFAEVGIAIDYKKRPNVLRIRAETEQFLLQAPSQQHHITWTNTVQMGIDVALPLEERSLPKYRLIPRRRRHDQRAASAAVHSRSDRAFFSRIVNHLRTNTQATPKRLRQEPSIDPPSSTPSDVVPAAAPLQPQLTIENHSDQSAAPATTLTLDNTIEGTDSAIDEEEIYRGEEDSDSEEPEETLETSEEDDILDLISSYAPSVESAPMSAFKSSTTELDVKWEPEHPEQSNRSLLKYASRCLMPLPASQTWLDKPVVHQGRKYIVKRDTLERVAEATFIF